MVIEEAEKLVVELIAVIMNRSKTSGTVGLIPSSLSVGDRKPRLYPHLGLLSH